MSNCPLTVVLLEKAVPISVLPLEIATVLRCWSTLGHTTHSKKCIPISDQAYDSTVIGMPLHSSTTLSIDIKWNMLRFLNLPAGRTNVVGMKSR